MQDASRVFGTDINDTSQISTVCIECISFHPSLSAVRFAGQDTADHTVQIATHQCVPEVHGPVQERGRQSSCTTPRNVKCCLQWLRAAPSWLLLCRGIYGCGSQVYGSCSLAQQRTCTQRGREYFWFYLVQTCFGQHKNKLNADFAKDVCKAGFHFWKKKMVLNVKVVMLDFQCKTLRFLSIYPTYYKIDFTLSIYRKLFFHY